MKTLSKCHGVIRTSGTVPCTLISTLQSGKFLLRHAHSHIFKNSTSHHVISAVHCRHFCLSYPLSSFWNSSENRTHSSHGVKISPQHDGKSLVDRYIFVKTLDNFYEDIPNGIILDTAYADSRPGDECDPIVPVVLGLHDTPGNHHDLLPLLTTFAKMGCRTIAPSFPGHGYTQGLMKGFDDVFTHSTMEKAMFINDFLGDLGIDRVDLLVAVGAAAYPALRLCVGGDTSAYFKSVALISPWPLQRPRYQTNIELTKKIQDLWDRPFLRAPMRLLLPVYKVGDIHDTKEKITTAYLLNNLDLGEAGGLALAAATVKLPRTVIFGELDDAVEKELYYDVLSKLEIPQSNISVFRGKLGTPCLPGALVFPEGGYDLHLKHSGLLSAYLLHMVNLFHPQIRI